MERDDGYKHNKHSVSGFLVRVRFPCNLRRGKGFLSNFYFYFYFFSLLINIFFGSFSKICIS